MGGMYLFRRKYVFLSFIGVLCIIIVSIYISKPNEADFIHWFKDKYNLRCEDENCSVVSFKNKGVEFEGRRYWDADGYYDNSTNFLGMGMQIKKLYRSVSNPNEFFSIEVKGFMGNFEIIEIHQNGVNVLLE